MTHTPTTGPRTSASTRELTHAEWQWFARRDRRRRLAFACAAPVAACAAFYCAGPARVGAAASADAMMLAVTAVAFAAAAVVCLALAVHLQPERPGGRARRVGPLREIVRVQGRPSRVTIGGVPVQMPSPWQGRLPRDTFVDVEVTPPIEHADGWLQRTAIHQIVSAYDGRLRVADFAATPFTEPVESEPPRDEVAIARARAAVARPLTAAERDAAAALVAPDYGTLVLVILPAVGTLGVCAWGAATIWPVWRVGSALLASVAGGAAYVAVYFTRPLLQPHWLGSARDFSRAGRLTGLVAVHGAPPRTYVAGVHVALPMLSRLQDGTDADVEVTPPLADDPNPGRGRIVVAVLAGASPTA